MPNRSKGTGQTKCDPSGPPGRGFGWGLITHSRKNKTITETGDIQISINIAYYYSTIAPFYHIRAKERAKYATLLHCRTGKNTD